MESLLDDIDGRLTRVTIRYPQLQKAIWKHHKHVKHALLVSEIRKEHMKDLLGWMSALMVNLPDLEPELHGVVDRLKVECARAAIS